MKYKFSFLNIEYGSLNLITIFRSFLVFFKYIFLSNENVENRLKMIFKKKFRGDIFFLKNARSSIGFFLRSQGIGKDDEVILNSFTCLAVPYGILSSGAKPVYCDIDKSTLCFDLKQLKKKINNKVKAVIVQHTLGKSANIIEIKNFLKKKNILLIEDCALSIGAKLNNKLLGCFGDASIFSMELSKTISSGWGGILLVNNKKLLKSVFQEYLKLKREENFKSFLKHIQLSISVFCYNAYIYFLGRYLYSFFYKIKIFKPSSSPSEKNAIFKNNFFEKLGRFQIILAIIQLNDFDRIVFECRNNFNIINDCLISLNIKTLPKINKKDFLVSNRICFLVQDRKKFINYFNINGVSVGKWFDGPLSPNPNSRLFNYKKNEFRIAGKISKKIVNLPCNSGMSYFDCKRIVILLNRYFLDNK
jgi:perosamine synthetase